MNRAVEIAVALAEAGLHLHAKSMDLVIAAVTGQPTEWISPPEVSTDQIRAA